MATLQEQYKTVIAAELQKKLGLKNPMDVPKLEKIVLNVGAGESTQDKNLLPTIAEELALISGQKAVITKARKSIAGFSIREGWPIGCKVTLRDKRMYEFFERFVNVAIPRIRDFRGFSPKSFDGRGNLTVGIKEHIIFPEIDYEKVNKLHGMDVCVTTTARTDDAARELISALGFPFRT